MTNQTHHEVAARWNQNADQWTADARNGYDVQRALFTFPAFLEFLPDIAGLDVIDFGCGEGTNTRHFAKMGPNLTGIDISPDMIAHAQQAEISDPIGVTLPRIVPKPACLTALLMQSSQRWR